MRVGLTLSGDNLSEDGAIFATQLGLTNVVIHFNDDAAGPDAALYLRGETVGPTVKICRNVAIWDYKTIVGAVARLTPHRLRIPRWRTSRRPIGRHPARWPGPRRADRGPQTAGALAYVHFCDVRGMSSIISRPSSMTVMSI